MELHIDKNAEINIVFAIGSSSNHAKRIFRELLSEDFFDGTCKRRFEKYRKAYQIGQYTEFAVQHRSQLETPENVMPLWDAVKVVQNHAIRRKVEKAMQEVGLLCRDYSNDISGLQIQLKDTILEAIDSRVCKSPSRTKDDLIKVMDEMEKTNTAFFTGLPHVDRYAPIQPTDFVMICARPGVGKSALSSGMVLQNFLGPDKRRGIFFCIEMDVRQNYARLSSQMSNVPLSKYINRQHNQSTAAETQAMLDSFGKIGEEFPERWFVQGAVSIEEIEEMVEIHKPDWIMVDYVQIVKASGEGHERLTKISMALRMLALEKNIAVIAIAQLKRDASGAVPSMSQIKGSGQFEQDATHIFLLDRPESEPLNSVAPRNYCDERGTEVAIWEKGTKTNKACLICSKNRNGAPFYQILNFYPESASFNEY